MSICFKISYNQKCENCDNLSHQIKILPICRYYQKNTTTICLILHQFNLYVLLIIEGKIGDD